MDQGLKERLVGAAVLVAIAVWLIPWVLDGPEAPLETNGSSLQLPAAEEPMPMRTQTLRLGDVAEPSRRRCPDRQRRPSTETAAVDAPAASEPESQAGAGAGIGETQAVVAARTEPERAAPPPAQPAAGGHGAAETRTGAATSGDWTVQLGSFGEEANARRVAQRAGTFGYKAEVSSVRRGGRTLYRVRVGPQSDACRSRRGGVGVARARHQRRKRGRRTLSPE